ncbi:hypothetical protein SAMN05421770_11435 [Granulicella rosea]|uniref:Uncharacterized protein n=1 Tax=Granulicella rosea TaxID=474952 RepID=A0A239MJL7_9BACT|nr:hypothetical protein [Granulicella rosea]SNT42841.1 hypothetical protein SAMN05421770_11435 [Granulicella rosea]
MANFTKPQRSKLPPPPALNEATDNLRAPEHAPLGVVDGRTLRATGRTQQLSTRVTEAFHRELKVYAVQHKLKLNELLEMSFEAFKRANR